MTGKIPVKNERKKEMREIVRKIKDKAVSVYTDAKTMMISKRAEGYVDTGVKILIAVVLGALLLAGLYALFNETILPTVEQRVQDLFAFGV